MVIEIHEISDDELNALFQEVIAEMIRRGEHRTMLSNLHTHSADNFMELVAMAEEIGDE